MRLWSAVFNDREKEILKFAQESAKQEASAYARDERSGLMMPVKSRFRETIDFCERMGYRRICLAFAPWCIPVSTDHTVMTFTAISRILLRIHCLLAEKSRIKK